MTCRKFQFLRVLPIVALAACTQFPELEALEGAEVEDAEYPRLLPIQELLEGPEPSVGPAIEEEVLSRVAALQARAKRLTRGPVVDRATRKRMAEGVQTVQ